MISMNVKIKMCFDKLLLINKELVFGEKQNQIRFYYYRLYL